MREPRRSARARVVGALALIACALALAACAPDGPSPVAWDRVACAHCRMLVSDPRFAAQLQLADGEVMFFDDPGCLLVARRALARPVRAAWFHDSRSDAWLPESDVAFVRAAQTPMGWGFAAVRAGSDPQALREDAVLPALAEREEAK